MISAVAASVLQCDQLNHSIGLRFLVLPAQTQRLVVTDLNIFDCDLAQHYDKYSKTVTVVHFHLEQQ